MLETSKTNQRSRVSGAASRDRQEVAIVYVPMRLARIVISEINDQQIVFLREIDGPRSFPILIGLFEASSIDRRVRGHIAPRPLTHDLLRETIEQMGGEPDTVLITHLEDHTYYAVIQVKRDGETIQLDARPSDALALSVHCDPPLPLLVAEDVLEEAAS